MRERSPGATLIATMLAFLIAAPVLAGNRLAVPLLGSWNFDLESVTVAKSRVVFEVQRNWNVAHTEVRDLVVAPVGTVQAVRFRYQPAEPGHHRANVRVLGGAAYTWTFAVDTIDFDVQGTPDFVDVPPGVSLQPLREEGPNVVFTFILDETAVERCAQDAALAEQYMRFVTWRMAGRCITDFDLFSTITVGVAATIAYRAQ
jgi:hypothetical protein